MKSITLKIDDDIFGETEKIRERIRKSRNSYIIEAIGHFNSLQQRDMPREKIARESKLVREDSLQVLRDFEILDDKD